MTTDTSERGLERLVCTILAGHPCEPSGEGVIAEEPAGYGGVGWSGGRPADYDREYCVDLLQLERFLRDTQPEVADAVELATDGPVRHRFLARLQGEIARKGTIDLLRNGIKHDAHHIELFYGAPSAGNEKAAELFELNRFTVTRQLRYSRDETQRSLDLGLFINGLPIFTFELKNSLTKQTVNDAIWQYKKDRNSREKLFEFGRCVAHFAVDESEVMFCTHLKGESSWFLPFNRGWNDGAGNPPNPNGLKTDYLWKEVLTRESLTNILENYAQVIEEKDEKTGRKKKKQIWPRYHQLDAVRRLLADVALRGAGGRYLIQHSAGSGKSNSIAWLAHQLIGLTKEDANIFDSVIVVTDRRVLDAQLRNTIRQYAQVSAIIGAVTGAGSSKTKQLTTFLESGKKLIICTIQTFPHLLKEIGDEQRGKRFAILIDEAHSSQGRRTSTALAKALSVAGEEKEEETYEDRINRIMESGKMLPNASYFAFTATPKNKTLEIFGRREEGSGAHSKYHPFHNYSMKQAIQEGFILDVLKNYTPVVSYFHIAKKIEEDPEFDQRKALKKIRRYVEGHDHAVRIKAEIMVDHFQSQVVAQGKIGGEARAMVVTNGVERAIKYFHEIGEYLREQKSKWKAIVAFSGEHEFGGVKVTEASLNGFPSGEIPEKIQENPYRFLICADKFQTGYDEPLLQTMYVDKTLSGIKAVQTLSRLNRAHPKKHDAFVLDFVNDADTIQDSFAPFYRTTILSGETDPNKLHDLQNDLDSAQIYSQEQIDQFVQLYLDGVDRDHFLDPILDVCIGVYREELDEEGQVEFKGKAKAFLRTYGFLSSILPYNNAEWEKRSIFLNFLVSRLPAPEEKDLSKGILDAIDMDSYRAEKQAMQQIILPDSDAEIEPSPTGSGSGGVGGVEPTFARLSLIIEAFNRHFGNIEWEDSDEILRLVTEAIPAKVDEDDAYRNAQENSDEQNARIELNKTMERVMNAIMRDQTQLFKQFMDNESFKRWVLDTVFDLTYRGKR